jgi:hypothetical protein
MDDWDELKLLCLRPLAPIGVSRDCCQQRRQQATHALIADRAVSGHAAHLARAAIVVRYVAAQRGSLSYKAASQSACPGASVSHVSTPGAHSRGGVRPAGGAARVHKCSQGPLRGSTRVHLPSDASPPPRSRFSRYDMGVQQSLHPDPFPSVTTPCAVMVIVTILRRAVRMLFPDGRYLTQPQGE